MTGGKLSRRRPARTAAANWHTATVTASAATGAAAGTASGDGEANGFVSKTPHPKAGLAITTGWPKVSINYIRLRREGF